MLTRVGRNILQCLLHDDDSYPQSTVWRPQKLKLSSYMEGKLGRGLWVKMGPPKGIVHLHGFNQSGRHHISGVSATFLAS